MKRKNLLGLLVGLLVLYVIYKIVARTERQKVMSNAVNGNNGGNGNSVPNVVNGNTGGSDIPCIDPKFIPTDISGRSCSGTEINESKMLRLGDVGCDVLLLQQRLNGVEKQTDILTPNGQFNCATLNKLRRVKGVNEMALNQFQPEEQIGFNEFQGGERVLPYSYMDAVNLPMVNKKFNDNIERNNGSK